MTQVLLDEGQFVAQLIYGDGARSRSTAPEPALLPHLGAWLCHDFSIEEVLRAAWEFAHQGSVSPPWMPLWEATLWGIAGRDDLKDNLVGLDIVTPNHWRVVQALRESRHDEGEALAAQRVDIGANYPPAAGAARLAPLLTVSAFEALIADPLIDPATLDAESVRSILEAAKLHAVDIPDAWIDAAVDGNWFSIPPVSRRAHFLPSLPADSRMRIADELAQWVTGLYLPPDMRALWISRVAPFVSPTYAWDRAQVLDDLESVWRDHIDALLAESWPDEPWEDVFRAHPEYEVIRDVRRPHETTADAPADIRSRWQGMSAAMPDSSDDATRGGLELEEDEPPATRRPPPIDEDADAPPAPPMEPRRLQADVLLEDSMNDVTAFVANQAHVIDVSIGRGARIRADVDIEDDLDDVFRETDRDWIVLPVWFHAAGQEQSGKLRVPRDKTKNSTSHSFSFTAPDSGRVLARIHVMRPGGRLLLQSAVLAGDVVGSEAEADSHDPGIELNVDVTAGNLHDPQPAENGQAVITDETEAVTGQEGAPVRIDVAELQDYLVKLVRKIEKAAERQGRDDAAVDKVLVELARAGQRLRVEFESQLGSLADADPLQIVSLRTGDVLPLELVYDGPPLSTSSTICPTWQDALREGNCNNCAGGGPDNDDAPARVCPMRFWSMHKVIERRSADTSDGQFHVAAERTAGRPSLRPIESAIVAASGRVAAADVSALADFAVAQLGLPAETAANWAEWIAAIGDKHPELLVAMPHNQPIDDGLTSALMMGEPDDDNEPVPDEAALLAGSVTEAHVQVSGDRPGPILLLLGCNTQFEQGRLSGFAGEFRKNGAALTVGTLGKLRADQAPRAAHELLDQIMQPGPNMQSVGEVLLATRRRLLGDGMIMGLLLVANGDAEWLLP